MDEKLRAALEFSNYRLTLNNQKQNLKMRMQTMLTISHGGNMFTAKLELINFVKQLIDLGIKEQVVLDDNENPVIITDLVDFHSKLMSTYNAALTEYYIENEKLKKMRDTKKLVGINE